MYVYICLYKNHAYPKDKNLLELSEAITSNTQNREGSHIIKQRCYSMILVLKDTNKVHKRTKK